MDRLKRRKIRIVITLLHVFMQMLMAWNIFFVLGNRDLLAMQEPLFAIHTVLIRFSAMFGMFVIYYSLMKLFPTRTKSSRK